MNTPEQPPIQPQAEPPTEQEEVNMKEAMKYIESESLMRLKEIVEPCAIPAELIQELLLQRGAEVEDEGLLRSIALGLQQFYCQVFERARELSDSGKLTSHDLSVALIYSGNAPRVSLQFLDEFSRQE